MAKARNQYERQARRAAARIDRDRGLAEQLTFLSEPGAAGLPAGRDQDVGAVGKPRGRPAGAKNKGSSQLRQWLAEQGYVLPEEQIAQIAGLTGGSGDVVAETIARAERLMAWAYDGAHIGKGAAPKPTAHMRLEVFKFLYASARQAAEALLPYGTPKAAPEVAVNQTVNVLVPTGPGAAHRPGDGARVVSPASNGRMTPPPLPNEMQQEQQVSEDDPDGSDAESRTE